LCGFVKNQTGSALIEVEGQPPSLVRFVSELADRPVPPPAPSPGRGSSWRSAAGRRTPSSNTASTASCLSFRARIIPRNRQDKFKGLDIMPAVRSFDPCLLCGVHTYSGNGKQLDVQ
jgi:hypothetical protein